MTTRIARRAASVALAALGLEEPAGGVDEEGLFLAQLELHGRLLRRVPDPAPGQHCRVVGAWPERIGFLTFESHRHSPQRELPAVPADER